MDPRSAVVRKQNAKDTEGDELPYGWDEAEQNGETYYINHTTRTTSWLHPRLLLEEKRQEFVRLETEVAIRAEAHRDAIRQYRDKRSRLEDLRTEAGDAESVRDIESRLAAMDSVIDLEVNRLHDLLQENFSLKNEIHFLRNQFRRKEHESKYGLGTFDENDVDDLYRPQKVEAVSGFALQVDQQHVNVWVVSCRTNWILCWAVSLRRDSPSSFVEASCRRVYQMFQQMARTFSSPDSILYTQLHSLFT